MSSLWGSKKTDDGQEQEAIVSSSGSHSNNHSHTTGRASEDNMREPTERDRLLPADHRRAPHADGYLDPDDPAVRNIASL